MKNRTHSSKAAALGAAALALLGLGPAAQAQAPSPVDASNWGILTAPVFGTPETNTSYAGTTAFTTPDLFAGPNKLGDGNYYHGVLPNGKIVKPAGISVQIGMNPLGSALTPDGCYLITSNDDERDGGFTSLQNTSTKGGYSLTVVNTATMAVVSQITTAGKLFIGLQATGPAAGPYTVYASGGGDNSIKLFTVSATGTITAGPSIAIAPVTPSNAGFVSNYTPSAALAASTVVPSQFISSGSHITFPAGSALSPSGRYLYVACNGDNSLAVIDTTNNSVVKQIPVGFFPYGISVSRDGTKVLVTNQGVMGYKFINPTYDGVGNLTSPGRISPGSSVDGLFFVPPTDAGGTNPHTSSISVIAVPGGNPANATLLGSVYEGQPGGLDASYNVGETHPTATAIVRRGFVEVQYVAKANSDSLGLILVGNNRRLPDFDLSPLALTLNDGHKVHGSYPNALAVSPDNRRLYVAEAGLNSVAVLDTTNPVQPRLVGRIPTGWYPTALSLSPDGKTLYVVNAKGVGEDINPNTDKGANPTATGLVSFKGVDSNYIFGSVQKIDLMATTIDTSTVGGLNYAINAPSAADSAIVPVGGAASNKIKHVIFILHENKTFDSMLGNQGTHFGPFASTTFNGAAAQTTNAAPDGTAYTSTQFTPVSYNTQQLALAFATGVNYYSDSEESDAGHQFAASGTSTDYTQKTLLVKSGRGALVNKNFEPEDYPEGGYIFNNAARNGVSFKDYGALVRILGTDTGGSTPTAINDPLSGFAGFPSTAQPVSPASSNPGNPTGVSTSAPVVQVTGPGTNPNGGQSDVTSPTVGLGQSYFQAMPILAILGSNNPTGEPRLDRNYPGYNFNISDQRRAKEFIADFDRMVKTNTLPQFLYIYQPNDHTGGTNINNVPATAAEEVADGDMGLGMVMQHIMSSPAYYDASTDTGSAIFITYDDAQSTLDHIHPHRTPLVVVSPFAKKGYLGTHHYVTASVVKTEELLLGLPPNNYGDLFATDLRDLFQPTYNGITAAMVPFNSTTTYMATAEGRKVWNLAAKLDTSAPDRDSRRLGLLARLSMQADTLHWAAAKKHHLHAAQYQATQSHLYQVAARLVSGSSTAPNGDD